MRRLFIVLIVLFMFSLLGVDNVVARGGYGVRINYSGSDSYIHYFNPDFGCDVGFIEVGLVLFSNTTISIIDSDPGGEELGFVIELTGVTWWDGGSNTSFVSMDFMDGNYYVFRLEWTGNGVKLYVNNIYVGLFTGGQATIQDIVIGIYGEEYIWGSTGKNPSGTALIDYVYINGTNTYYGDVWELYDDLDDLNKTYEYINVEIVDISPYIEIVTTTATSTITSTVTSTVTTTTTIYDTTTVTSTAASTVYNVSTITATVTDTTTDTATLILWETRNASNTAPPLTTVFVRPGLNTAYIVAGLFILLLVIIIGFTASKHR